MLGVDAGGGGIEDPLGVAAAARFEHVEIDLRRIVHDVGVVLAGEDVASAAHVGGELVDLVEAAVDCSAGRLPLAQIAD